MSKVMSLAKNYDSKKTPYPAIAQIKYDGVPATFKKVGGHVLALTRQSEIIKSVDHIKEVLSEVLRDGDELTMELLVRGEVDFKTISGIVRRQVTDTRIFGKVFDGAPKGCHDEPYLTRYDWFRYVSNACLVLSPTAKSVQLAVGKRVNNEDEMLAYYSRQAHYYAEADAKYPDLGIRLEGIMLHDIYKPYTPGKRIWGMSRYKPQPTIDLEVVGFEEATSEAGEPLGMVGRVNVRLRRRLPSGAVSEATVGVGPGKLTHAERRLLWEASADGYLVPTKRRIAEIKYMPDPSYDALRQPTFQCWRPDKTEADILEY